MSSIDPQVARQVAQSSATESVQIDVPVCFCVVCRLALPGQPTSVLEGKATAWDPPDKWLHGKLDDAREIYFCATCAEKLPRANMFGVR